MPCAGANSSCTVGPYCPGPVIVAPWVPEIPFVPEIVDDGYYMPPIVDDELVIDDELVGENLNMQQRQMRRQVRRQANRNGAARSVRHALARDAAVDMALAGWQQYAPAAGAMRVAPDLAVKSPMMNPYAANWPAYNPYAAAAINPYTMRRW